MLVVPFVQRFNVKQSTTVFIPKLFNAVCCNIVLCVLLSLNRCIINCKFHTIFIFHSLKAATNYPSIRLYRGLYTSSPISKKSIFPTKLSSYPSNKMSFLHLQAKIQNLLPLKIPWCAIHHLEYVLYLYL